jgi:hypothetical protein
MPLAPIALFVFRRPDHTRRTIESLLANPEAAESPVIVFADGPRSEGDVEAVERTRAVVRSAGLANLRMVERDQNMGLAQSVIAGVTEVCGAEGSAIVLEDDLVLAPTFLRFMNEALERYRDDPRVFGISGYMFPVEPPPGRDSFLLPFIGSWGWATWMRAWATLAPAEESHVIIGASRASRWRFDLEGSYPYWAMFEALLANKVDSWAIRWYATVFRRNGLMLYPARSLVTNIGFDGTGVHCGVGTSRAGAAIAADFIVRSFPAATAVDAEAFRRVKRLFRRDTGALPRLVARTRYALGRVLRR